MLVCILIFGGGWTAITKSVLLTGGVASASAEAKPTDSQMLECVANTVMQPVIKSAINTFYGQYLNQLPEISIAETKITDIISYNGGVFFDVMVETKPFIEKNVPIGQDKISLYVDVFGLVFAEKYEHQGNNDLPQSYKDRIIKPIPEKTVIRLPKRKSVDSDIEARPDNQMTKAQKLDALVRVLVISEVQNAVNVFYNPYLSSPSINAYFGYEIVELGYSKDELGVFTLILTITPYVGAHNPIGKEKITMEIWENGVVFVTDYEHLETYDIVPWLADILKKPLPEGTQKRIS